MKYGRQNMNDNNKWLEFVKYLYDLKSKLVPGEGYFNEIVELCAFIHFIEIQTSARNKKYGRKNMNDNNKALEFLKYSYNLKSKMVPGGGYFNEIVELCVFIHLTEIQTPARNMDDKI